MWFKSFSYIFVLFPLLSIRSTSGPFLPFLTNDLFLTMPLPFSIILFVMLVAVITTIAVCKWKMTKGLGATMFTLYAVFVGQDLVRNFCIPCGAAVDAAFGISCDL